MRTVILGSVLILVVVGCSNAMLGEDEDSTMVTANRQAVTGWQSHARRIDGDITNCDTGVVSDAQMLAFTGDGGLLPDGGAFFLQRVLARARVVSNSPAYQSCIRDTITVGRNIVSGRTDTNPNGSASDLGAAPLDRRT